MLKYVEIWHRQSADAAYRRHGIEELETLLEAGAAMSLVVEGNCRRVTIDRAAPTAVSIAAIGTLWVTDICQSSAGAELGAGSPARQGAGELCGN